MPPTHGRYPYSPITVRPVYDWPDGKRLAIYIGLNLEWFAFGEGLGAELAPAGPQPDVLNYSWRDYGNRVGVFRLADLLGVWMKTRAGRILSVPYPQELNDIPQIVARKREGADFADMIVDAFDVLRAECDKRPLVMGIALHPYIVGWPHRFKHLARALKHLARKADDKVWFTTSGAIAQHAAALPQGTVP